MKMEKYGLLLLLVGCALPLLAAAEPADGGSWSGKLGVGFLSIDGNTESESLNADVGLGWDGERWHHTLAGRALGKEESGTTTAEAYKLAYDAKFDLSQRTYVFGLLDYNKDRFSSYDQQVFEVLGMGQRLLASKRQQLNIEAGVGATQNKLLDGSRQDQFTARLSGDYRWQISENAAFGQTLAINWSADNTYTEAVSELRAGLVGNVGMTFSFTIKNNSDVLPGTEKTDTWTALNIEYAF